jgi:hypothetical protein
MTVVVDEDTDEEVVAWTEPDDLRLTDGPTFGIEVADPGKREELRRANRPLAFDIWA